MCQTRWQAGLEAAEAFKEVGEAQAFLLGWLVNSARHLPGIEGVEYAVSVLKRFPQHEEVQRKTESTRRLIGPA